jgi:REP element-mobilizing transposase RayT
MAEDLEATPGAEHRPCTVQLQRRSLSGNSTIVSGFVSNVRDGDGPEVKHNTPGTPCDAKQRGLALAARAQMKGDPVLLTAQLAQAQAAQFHETASYRGWSLLALAIMANHVHLVVAVPDDPDPEVLLRDFKSYGSRCLNKIAGKPASGTWWTAGGSRRKLPHERAVHAAVHYVEMQERPLVIWRAENPAANAAGSPDDRVL